MAFMKWAATAAAVVGMVALVSGCGGSGDGGGSAEIRLVNASTGYSTLDLTVDSKSASSNVAYGTAGSYSGIGTSGISTQIVSGGTTIASLTPTLTGGKKYSLIAYGWSGAARYSMLEEAQAAPDSGKSTLLVLNLAPDAGALSVYLSADCTTAIESATVIASSVAGGSGSGYNTTTAGTYCVRVIGSGGTSDLRLTVPSVNLASAQVATLILTPTSGGVLVNGMTMIQTGTVASYAGSNARARVIASVPGARVTATRGGTELASAIASGIALDYATVTSGNTAVTVTVTGAAAPITVTPAMAAGGDYTVLVWGTAAAPKVSILTDDNRLPTVAGQAKMRLINGLANLDGGLTMTADASLVANNVLAGTASGYTSLTSNTTATLSVTAPAFADQVFPTSTSTTNAIAAGAVYDVIMTGDGSALSTIRGTLRKVR